MENARVRGKCLWSHFSRNDAENHPALVTASRRRYSETLAAAKILFTLISDDPRLPANPLSRAVSNSVFATRAVTKIAAPRLISRFCEPLIKH